MITHEQLGNLRVQSSWNPKITIRDFYPEMVAETIYVDRPPEVDLVPAIPNKALNVPAKQRDNSHFRNMNHMYIKFLFQLIMLNNARKGILIVKYLLVGTVEDLAFVFSVPIIHIHHLRQ